MAIWGTTAPKFVASGSTVLLDNAIILPTWADPRFIEQTSVENGERTYDQLGDYSEFQVIINLFKEGSTALAKAKFNEIYAHRFSTINEFYPHRDGDCLRDDGGTAVPFTMTECSPFYLDSIDPDVRDKLKLVFKSNAYTDLEQSQL